MTRPKKEGYVQINILVPKAVKDLLPELRTLTLTSDTAVIVDLILAAAKKKGIKIPD